MKFKVRLMGLLALAITSLALAQTYNIFSPGPVGPVKSNGSYALQQEFSSDIVGLFTGCGSSTPYLAFGGACLAGPLAANPTAVVGLTAVNGSATTYMRSDAAPPLSQSISPTMTGNWIHTPSAGVGVTMNGVAGSYATKIVGSSTSGSSDGLNVAAGTVGTDTALLVTNQTASSNLLQIFGNGGTTMGSPTGGNEGVNSLNVAGGIFINGVAVGTGAGSVTQISAGTGITLTPNPITTTGTVSVTTPFGGLANPTGTVGLTAVNGTATTAMRSDAAPPLSQAIVPTWTGTHTYTGTSPQVIHSTAASANNYEEWTNGTQTMFFGISSNNIPVLDVSSNDPFQLYTNGTQRVVVGAAGNVLINAPSSGIGLISGCAGSAFVTTQIQACSSAGTTFLTTYDGTIAGFLGSDTTAVDMGAFSNHAVNIRTNNANRISVAAAGNVSISPPTSGVSLTVSGNAGSATPILTIAGGTNGSAPIFLQDGQTGTRQWVLEAGNPAAGDFRIRDNTRGADVLVVTPTGNTTISAPSSGNALNVFGANNSNTLAISGGSTSGQSFGLVISAGTTGSDYPLLIQAHSGAQLFEVFGDGGQVNGSPTGGNKGPGTVNATGLYINGVAVNSNGGLINAACYVTVSGTTPTLNNRFGCSGISRSSTGVYSLTLSAGFTQRPVCNISPYGGSPFLASYNDPSTATGIIIDIYNTSGTLTDPTGFMVTCMGN